MEEYRKVAMLSTSTSATSTPAIGHKQCPGSTQSSLYLKQMQHQLQIIRCENEDLAKNGLSLQKRIHELEEDKVVVSSNFNKENAELQTLVTRLQSQLERGEAARQSLEYDLAITKKKLSDNSKLTTHKEVTLTKENILLSDEKSTLELQVAEVKNELNVARKVAADNEKRIALLEDQKRQVQSDKMASEAILRAQNEKLLIQNSNSEYEKEQLRLSLEDLKKQHAMQEENIQKIVDDLQASVDREERLRHKLDEKSQRACSLEECVEAERAAHLESKFNSEIIQLKHEEFQTQLMNEKDACEKLKLANDENKVRLADLEKQLNFERQQYNDANAKLEKTMQAYADVRKQLNEELSVKNHVINDTTNKLEEHQDALCCLKEELAKTKKQMICIKEERNADARELEMLLDSLCNDPAVHKYREKIENKMQISDYPKQVLECLRKNLFAHQKKISNLKVELENVCSSKKELEKDCNNFRDLALSREKSMQQAQQTLNQNKAELESIRLQQAEYVREADRAQLDLKEMTAELEQHKEKCQEFEKNIASVKERHSNEFEVHVSFLRELHHVVSSANGDKSTLNRFTWSDLSMTIRESVDSLINNHQRAKDKVIILESSSQEMQQSIAELQRAHAASVDRLADRCRERDEEGARQRKQLEQHYEALLAEMNSRTRKTQALCDEAWERIRTKDGLQDGLQAECAQLRGENSNLLQERKSLLYACAILFGALYPAFRARDELAQQRSLLERFINNWDVCKLKMRSLVATFHDELGNEEDDSPSIPASFRFTSPLIRFRVAVICVLASNRLRYMTSNSNPIMFCCDESAASTRRIVVVAGKGEKTSSKSPEKLSMNSTSDAAVEWLTDNRVVHGVRDATCGLVDAVSKHAGDASGFMPRAVVKTAKTTFHGLIDSTRSKFPSYTVDARSAVRGRSSLCHLLSNGLDRIIRTSTIRPVVNLFSIENSFSALQSHLISFTERLHAAEVEKRSLRHNEASLLARMEQLNVHKDKLEQRQKELEKSKEKERDLVSRARFQGVCSELNCALDREKQAQKLLREQNTKLQELSGKLEDQCNSGVAKEVALSQAANSLSEVKMELKRCSHNKYQLELQVEKLQAAKSKLQLLVHDAKSALKRAVGEKATIADYFATVEKTLQTGGEESVTEQLRLQSEELDGETASGLKAAKRAVDTFVRAQSSAISRIDNLESQIASYRLHIDSLKRELHNACHRQSENPADFELSELPTKDKNFAPTSPTGPGSFYSHLLPDGDQFHLLHGELMEEASLENSNLSKFKYSSPSLNDFSSTPCIPSA